MSDTTTSELILIEQQVANEGPSLVVAYLLWLLLGFVSGHRFYLGRPRSAVLQVCSYFILVGVVWWFMDLFAIPAMVAEKRQALRTRLLAARAARTPAAPVAPAAAQLPAGDQPVDQLARLWELEQAGALSEAKYEAEKTRVLGL